MEAVRRMIDALLETMELKEEKRTGWELKNIESPESVADHSWGVSFLLLLFGQSEDINMEKALKISIVHDLSESKVGDIASREEEEMQKLTDEEKYDAELEAISNISKDLGRHELRQLWKEYKAKKTPEAKLVNDMDKIEMCIQALKYYTEGRYDPDEDQSDNKEYQHLDEFYVSADKEIKTEIGRELFNEIEERYEKHREN